MKTSKSPLNRLFRGISTSDFKIARSAWHELLDDPEGSIPVVCKQLRSKAWREKPKGPSGKYLAVLLALLDQLDREKFKEEIRRLRRARLHPWHRQTLDIMARRRGDQLFGKINERLPAYISDDIDQAGLVFKYLQRWSQTPDLDILNVTRIDVIAFRPEMDYLGRYDILSDGIILTWRNETSNIFDRWWRKIRTELTFYHEVGHHYHQHSEGGYDPDKEREADDYKWRMFRKAYPVFIAIARVVLFPLILIYWLLRYREKRKDAS